MQRYLQAALVRPRKGGREYGYVACGGVAAQIDSCCVVCEGQVDDLHCGVGVVAAVDGEDEVCSHAAGGGIEGGDAG